MAPNNLRGVGQGEEKAGREAQSVLLEEVVLRMTVADETEKLALVVLLAANRTQAKGSTVRLIVPRAPEVAQELGVELDDDLIVAVEEYLLNRGYVAPANIGLSWGTYTITPAGFSWLEESSPESSTTDRLRELADKKGEEEAFEAALRAELERESRRMEEVERELGEEPSGGPQSAGAGSVREETPPGGEGAQVGAEPRSWWRRIFGD
jgi:hypothetical protein